MRMTSVRVLVDQSYLDRGTAAFMCMHGGALSVGERFDASGYCLDAVEVLPGGASVRFESRATGLVYAMDDFSFRW